MYFWKKSFFVILWKGAYFCKKEKKRKENTYHVKKTQPSAYKHMPRQIYTYTETPAPECTLLHTHIDRNIDKHMHALFTHPQCSHPTDANTQKLTA